MENQENPNKDQILLPSGEINPLAYATDPLKKLEALEQLFPPDKYNIVMFSQFLMNALPEGIKLLPQFVRVTDEDLWDEKNAEEVKIKPGHVMLRSEKVANIGQAVGIRLEKYSEGELKIGGIVHFQIEYVASLRLPDGTEIKSPPTGKSLPAFTSSGKIQSHLQESVDRKARRNAIKQLLAIPTQMKREEAKKMWVCVRAVIGDGSEDSQRQIKEIAAEAAVSSAALYDDPKTNQMNAEEMESKINSISNQKEWDEVNSLLNENEKSFNKFEFQGLRSMLGTKYRSLNPNTGGKL